MAADSATDPTSSQRLRDAISVFDQRVPNAQQLRHALEHFDDYSQGKGFSQKATPWRFNIEWENTSAVLTIGPGLSLCVADATEAAMELHMVCAKEDAKR
jgi:hypothetical protein